MCAQRPSTAPDFLLSRTTGSVRTQGSVQTYTDVDKAIDDIEAQRVEMVVGALPFDLDKPSALAVPGPHSLCFSPFLSAHTHGG